MDQIRRGNYDSGQHYVLEYGDLRFTFNERDFSERVDEKLNAWRQARWREARRRGNAKSAEEAKTLVTD